MDLFLNNIYFIVLFILFNNNYIKSNILSYGSNHIILINDNYIMINNNGIYTYNSIQSKIVNHFYFDNNDNNKDKLPLITQFSHNNIRYIICLKNKIIYIFNELGLHLFSINFKDKNYNIFSIYLYEIKKADFYFVICYNDISLTNMKTFIYNINTKEIIEIKSLKMNFILNINCQIMNSDLYGDVLACFYFKKKFPFSLSVIIFNFKNELYQIISNTFDYELSKISNIKSFISKDYKKAIIYFYNNNYFYFINYFIDLNKFRIYAKNIFCKKNILNIRTKADFIYDKNYINTYKSITIYSSNSELFNLFRLFKKSLNILNYDDKTIKLFNKNLTVKNNISNFNYIKYKKEPIKNNKITSLRYLDDLSIKCSEVDDYSKKHLLCKSCSSGYYPIVNSNAGNRVAVNGNYKDCYNRDTIPSNYFLNANNEYEECFITCKTCREKGNQENNKCTSCIDNFIFNPKVENKNCVKKCEYYYYYNCFGEYKCTDNFYCPETNSFFIEEEKRCIDDCNNAGIYRYQYEGECISVCPSNTRLNDINNLCKDENNKCVLNSRKIKILGKYLSPNIINLMAKYYADEFSYTFNHITQFIGDNYYIYFYKNKSCLSELHLENYFLDFNECLLKITNNNNGLIPLVARIDILGKYNNPTTKYAFFDPNTGEKYDTKVCEGTTIIIKKNINYFLKKIMIH